jgi:hypothetical protein
MPSFFAGLIGMIIVAFLFRGDGLAHPELQLLGLIGGVTVIGVIVEGFVSRRMHAAKEAVALRAIGVGMTPPGYVSPEGTLHPANDCFDALDDCTSRKEPEL